MQHELASAVLSLSILAALCLQHVVVSRVGQDRTVVGVAKPTSRALIGAAQITARAPLLYRGDPRAG